MRLIPRVLAIIAMLVAMFLLIRHVHNLQEAEVLEMSKLAAYYFAILGLGAATAIVFCVSLLPLLGEFVGNVFFTPNEEIERNPHADALARLASGDFQGAIDEYRMVYDDNPEDLLATSEIVRLYCEKLSEYDLAAEFLVEALSYSDRTEEDVAFLSERLVDICWNFQHDGVRARAILLKIVEDMPETREAANALHRLQEIERAMQQPSLFSGDVAPRNEPLLVPPPPAPDPAETTAKPPEPSEKPDFWATSKKPPGSV